MKTNDMRKALVDAPVVARGEGPDGQYEVVAIGANTRRALVAVLDILDNIYRLDVHDEITAVLTPVCEPDADDV